MNTFSVQLRDSKHWQQINGVVSFVGVDASGSFGIQAHHARLITVLDYGLARLTTQDEQRLFLAMPGAVLYFNNNLLQLNTQRYVLCEDYRRIRQVLAQLLQDEQTALGDLKARLKHIEENMLWRLSRLNNDNTQRPAL